MPFRLSHRALILIIPLFLVLIGGVNGARAENEETFLQILRLSYDASCENVDRLREFYFPEAEIIHDGRQTTLNETIEELGRTLGELKGLVCVYKPMVRGSYIGEGIAFMTLRESIHIAAEGLEEREIRQICTYIFMKKEDRWKITHDHCSEIEGETV